MRQIKIKRTGRNTVSDKLKTNFKLKDSDTTINEHLSLSPLGAKMPSLDINSCSYILLVSLEPLCICI